MPAAAPSNDVLGRRGGSGDDRPTRPDRSGSAASLDGGVPPARRHDQDALAILGP